MWQAMLAQFGMQTAQNVMQGLSGRSQIIAQNAETKRANRENTREAMRAVGSLEVQKGFLRQQAAADMKAASQVAAEAGSAAEAVAAAAGVKGASVDAVQNSVEIELDRAITEVRQNAVMQEFNINQQIIDLTTRTRLNLGTFQAVPSKSSIFQQSLLGAGIDSASTYFMFGGGASGSPGAGPRSAPASMGGASIYSAGQLS